MNSKGHVGRLVVVPSPLSGAGGSPDVEGSDRPTASVGSEWQPKGAVSYLIGGDPGEMLRLVTSVLDAGFALVILPNSRALDLVGSGVSSESTHAFDLLELDRERHRITWDGSPLGLAESEYRSLSRLLTSSGQSASYEAVYQAIQGDEGEVTTDMEAVRAHVRRLRRKLFAGGVAVRIETIRGFGLRLSA